MNRKIRHRRYLWTIIIFAFLLIHIYPIFFMIQSSFKTTSEFGSQPIYTLPRNLYIENYKNAMKATQFPVLFVNTAIVTFASVAFSLILSSMSAFAIVKMRFRYQHFLESFLSIGMFIPAFVLLLPQFLLLKDLDLLNSRPGLILIFSGNVSLAVFLLTSFYQFLPDEILEASVIDGCGAYRMFWDVVIPMTVNGYVTVAMSLFFNIWNDLIISRTFTSSQSMRMIQTGLSAFTDEFGTRKWGETFAAVTMATIPTILFYLVMNRKIIDGLTAGSIKG